MDGTNIFLQLLVQEMVMDQSLIMKQYPGLGTIFQDLFEGLIFTVQYTCDSILDWPVKSCATEYMHSNGVSLQLCIKEYQVCDGVPQCHDLSDEDVDVCSEYFSTYAMDSACEAVNIFNNVTIYTKPIRCNGIIECRDQSDEANCKVDNVYLNAVIVIALILLLAISALTVASVDIAEKTEKGNITEKLSRNLEPGSLNNLQPLIVINQGTMHQKIINHSFMEHLKKFHENDFPSILKDLKVCTLLNIIFQLFQ